MTVHSTTTNRPKAKIFLSKSAQDRIKLRLKLRHLTTAWLADELGCAYRHLNGVLNGNRSPSLELLHAIAECVGMKAEVTQTIATDVKLRLVEKPEYVYVDCRKEKSVIEEPPFVFTIGQDGKRCRIDQG